MRSLGIRWWSIAIALPSLGVGCGTVDLGTYEGVRDVRPPEDYFYCVIQPQVLTAKRCAGGDPAQGDAAGGCHASTSALRLEEIPANVPCVSGKPTATPSAGERSNYTAASLRAGRDPDTSALLVKPTQKGGASHPRKIFETTANEADLIRKWIAGAR